MILGINLELDVSLVPRIHSVVLSSSPTLGAMVWKDNIDGCLSVTESHQHLYQTTNSLGWACFVPFHIDVLLIHFLAVNAHENSYKW